MQIRPKGDTGGQVSSKGGRARELLGVKIGPILSPGPLNAITDVPSVCVGMVQKFVDGPVSSNGDSSEKYARAGITAIGTRDIRKTPLFAGVEALQGSGELSGAHFIAESGQLATPILITGTQSVGAAYDGVSKATAQGLLGPGQMPVPVVLSCVAETYDRLSHPNSFTLGKRDVFETLQQTMKSEDHQPVKEGNVGGGTPMCSFGLKGGTGTSSRIVPNADGGSYTVGVLVQANHGSPINLTVDGVNVGRQLYEEGYTKPYYPSPGVDYQNRTGRDGDGSIIAVIATDAPLLPHQCKGLARRAGVGISRGGGGDGFFSGDIFIAFSTATPVTEPKPPSYQMIEPVSTYTINATTNETIDVLFRAAADATEEAVLNALCAAEELQGYNGRAYKTFPVQRVREILRDAGKDV